MRRLFSSSLIVLCVVALALVALAAQGDKDKKDCDNRDGNQGKITVEDVDAKSTEDEGDEEEAEEEEKELIIPEHKWGVQNKIDKQLKDTGLRFDPYSPGAQAYPVDQQHQRIDEVTPIVIIGDSEKECADEKTKK